ncbi:MAG: CDP-diacylglycerol--serine O-phosphatidyltransferase [Myxococcota bacterium]
MSVLPNLFTLGNLFCGFLAVVVCLDPLEDAVPRAALAICFGAFFDLADGRVARMTQSESALGEQLDSLSDIVTFGLAPAFVLYRWCLADQGALGVISAFAFLAAGALRLARYNVLSHDDSHEEGPDTHFLGLPIPLSASIMVSVILASTPDPAPSLGGVTTALLLPVGLGGLMVSTVRFRTFKDIRGRRLALHLAFGTTVVLLVATVSSIPAGFLFLFAGYVALSLLEAAHRSLRRAPSLS